MVSHIQTPSVGVLWLVLESCGVHLDDDAGSCGPCGLDWFVTGSGFSDSVLLGSHFTVLASATRGGRFECV